MFAAMSKPMVPALVVVACAMAIVSAPAARAQGSVEGRLPAKTAKMGIAGPRFGVTFLTTQARSKLKAEHDITLGPVMSQFGWQFERQFLGSDGGLTAVSEFVLMIGGLDQGQALPSASWLVGLRSLGGTEIGVGPNVTPGGVALAIAAGVTRRSGSVNIPFNIAVVPSKTGVRMSVLTGFTMR